MSNNSGCNTPFAFVFFAVVALYGMNTEVADGTVERRLLRILMFSTPLLVLLASSFLPGIWHRMRESRLLEERRRHQIEVEAERTRQRKLQEEENEKQRIYDAEQNERSREHRHKIEMLRQEEAQELAAEEKLKRQKAERKAWELKEAHLECYRQFEVFRHLLRHDFTESRFKTLLASHLGDDCPRDQIQTNKNEVLQLVALLVGESYGANEEAVKYNDVASAMDYFQREAQKIEDMENVAEDDKEMLIAILKKSRVVVLDRLMKDDTDSP